MRRNKKDIRNKQFRRKIDAGKTVWCESGLRAHNNLSVRMEEYLPFVSIDRVSYDDTFLRRAMASSKILRSRGRIVSVLTRTNGGRHDYEGLPLVKREFSRALREQGKKEIRQEMDNLVRQKLSDQAEEDAKYLEYLEQLEELRLDSALRLDPWERWEN